MLDWALEYAALGLRVLPLHNPVKVEGLPDKYRKRYPSGIFCSCQLGDDGEIRYQYNQTTHEYVVDSNSDLVIKECENPGKHPRWDKHLLANGSKSASSDPGLIKKWWTLWPDANIGLICGAGKGTGGKGLLIVDLDIKNDDEKGLHVNGLARLTLWQAENDAKFPDTLSVTTGSGGKHLYFWTDNREIKPRSDWLGDNSGIDIRYGGGYYAVMPPSEHCKGVTYQWDGAFAPSRIADANEAVYQFLSIKGKRGPKATGKPGVALRIYGTIPDGTRNDTLFRLACRDRGYGFDEPEILARLITVNAEKCDPPKPLSELETIAASAARYPKGGQAAKENQPSGFIRLALNDKGKVIQSIGNVLEVLNSDTWLAGKIALNLLTKRVCKTSDVPWGEAGTWSDRDDTGLRKYLEIYGLVNQRAIDDGRICAAMENQYNPLTDMLDGCHRRWDRQSGHIAQLLPTFLGTQDTDYHRAAWKLFMVGAVARAYEPGCDFDFTPILYGPQGRGKSKFIARLAMKREFYSSTITTFEGCKGIDSIRGVWIGEIAELLANKKSREKEEIKAFLTRTKDDYREAYGHNREEYPRTCVFIGTTNEINFLNDMTGDRRFLPIEVGEWKMRLADPAADEYFVQAWGEAVELYRNRAVDLRGTAEELQMFTAMQAEHEETDPWELSVRAYLEETERQRIQAVTIMAECLKIPVERRNRAVIGRINGILRKLDDWEEMRGRQRIQWREVDGFPKNAPMKNAFQRTRRKPCGDILAEEQYEIEERRAIREFGGG